MGCYHPTIIKIYDVKGLDKKVTKFEKIQLDNFEQIYLNHIDHEEVVTFEDKDTGEKVKAIGKCIDVVQVPCGNCIGCALDNARNWKTRLMCENTQHEKGYFLTFTYDEEHLPLDYQLKKGHAKELIKKLQNWAYRNNIKDFKYYLVGEYGSKSGRPHYHAIIWGINVDEELRKKWKTEEGHYIYTSPTFKRFWKYGNIGIGEITPQSLGYTCRYAVKKQCLTRDKKKELAKKHITAEFMMCSKGLGDSYYIQNFEKILKNNGVFYISGEELHTGRRFKKIADKMGRSEDVKKYIIEPNIRLNEIKRHNLRTITSQQTLNKELINQEWLKKQQIKALKRQ